MKGGWGTEGERGRRKSGRWGERKSYFEVARFKARYSRGEKTVEIKRPLQAREDRCFKNYPQGTIGGARVVFHQGQFRLHLPETSRNSQAQEGSFLPALPLRLGWRSGEPIGRWPDSRESKKLWRRLATLGASLWTFVSPICFWLRGSAYSFRKRKADSGLCSPAPGPLGTVMQSSLGSW